MTARLGSLPALTVLAAIIATIDAAQVVWLGKGLGAIGGFALYTLFGWGALGGRRWACWGALLLPALPTSILLGLQGPDVMAAVVDRPMVGVFAVQLAAAAAAAVHLVGARQEDSTDGGVPTG